MSKRRYWSWQNLLSWLVIFFLVIGAPILIVIFVRYLSPNPFTLLMIVVGYEAILFISPFTDRIRRRRASLLVKWIAQWVSRSAQKVSSPTHRYYYQHLIYQNRDFDLQGRRTLVSGTLQLDQVFVEPTIDPTLPHRASANPIQVPEDLGEGRHSIWDYLYSPALRDQHLVILGAPGSGKTTLLKHITLALAQQKKYPGQQRGAQRFPFLLFLSELADTIASQPVFSLVEAIEYHLEKSRVSISTEWIARQLQIGECLILLDGLDEVADDERRRTVARWVEWQMMAYVHNRFIIASRPFGYSNNPLIGVAVLEVQPFTQEQVERFIYNWYANEIGRTLVGDPDAVGKAQNGAVDLFQRLQNTPGLLALSVNPLMLTMMATFHHYGGTLPGKRVELYAEICKIFLGKLKQARGVVLELNAAQQQRVLQPLAYHLMDKGIREIPLAEVQEVIEEPLKWVNPQMTPVEFLSLIERRSGLLVERGNGIYSFAHKILQEYLAAMHIRELQGEKILLTRVGELWWHETIRLYCAMEDATALILACLEKIPPNGAVLNLALLCQEEALKLKPLVRSQLEKFIEHGIEDTDPERRRAVAEAHLLRRVDQMAYLRNGTYVDRSLITCAEYQVFLDEQQTQDRYYRPDHWDSLSFPEGSGRFPILGVRRSDAQAFCAWLTARSSEGWQYRLPRYDELSGDKSHLPLGLSPVTGYWAEGEPLFAWSQRKPPTALQEQFAGGVDRAIAHALTLDFDGARALAFDSSLAITRALDFDFTRTGDSGHDLKLALASAGDSTREVDFSLASARFRYVALFLLRERMAGRFPAYEGILLVRERPGVRQ